MPMSPTRAPPIGIPRETIIRLETKSCLLLHPFEASKDRKRSRECRGYILSMVFSLYLTLCGFACVCISIACSTRRAVPRRPEPCEWVREIVPHPFTSAIPPSLPVLVVDAELTNRSLRRNDQGWRKRRRSQSQWIDMQYKSVDPLV